MELIENKLFHSATRVVCFVNVNTKKEEKRSHGEKISFLKENGICFGCMCTGHISKDCRNRLSCKVCNLKHPSILHIYSRENVTDSNQVRKRMDTVMGSAPESVEFRGSWFE